MITREVGFNFRVDEFVKFDEFDERLPVYTY